MKMVKSAFLASAAGLVAMSGAQAADLPVKAKPVEYVKVCSLYGAGFYYIPGTDICMKIGGYIRYQINENTASITAGPFASAGAFSNRLNTTEFQQRVRAIATFDTRQQTAYGTLRTYLLMGYTQDTGANAGLTATAGANTPVYMTRAFIQIAGFTFGKATSFFDFVSTAAVAYNAGYVHAADTGDPGQIVGAYTAQFGNGVSATLGIEQSRRNPTVYLNGVTTQAWVNTAFTQDNLTPGTATAAINNASNKPDVVGNLRVDQAWGSAQVSGALHDASGGYYGLLNTGTVSTVGTEQNGHPSDKWGWAASVGLRLNAPMIGAGDYFQAQAIYTEGAIRYASFTPTSGGVMQKWGGSSFAYGQATDSVFAGTAAGGSLLGGDNNVHLTTAWSVFASYEHFWTPALRTSLYGSYLKVSYDSVANTMMCNQIATLSFGGGAGGAGCTNNFSAWDIGTRSQWNITKDLYVGVDVIYSKLKSAQLGGTNLYNISTFPTASGKPAGQYSIGDQDAWSATWRIHRDIVP